MFLRRILIEISVHGRAVALNVSINLSVTPHPAAMTTPRSDSPRIRQSGPLRAPSHRASGSQDHSASGRQDHSQFLALVLATTRCWNSLGGVPVWHVRVDLVPQKGVPGQLVHAPTGQHKYSVVSSKWVFAKQGVAFFTIIGHAFFLFT